MELKYGYPQLQGARKNCIALGTFDGVHIGHQKLIQTMVSGAWEIGARSVVFTFANHPRRFLSPDKAPFLLTPSQTKISLIDKLGVELMVLLPFDKLLAEMEPLEFVRDILVGHLQPYQVYVGYNFTFGSQGAGSPGLLEALGKRFGFKVNTIPAVCLDEQPISSTLIRKKLAAGDISGAKRYLGHWPIYQGKILPGDGLGTHLGYPTANLSIPVEVLLPPPGVYYGTAMVRDSQYEAMANIGFRPTVSNTRNLRFEIHILNYRGDLYGEELIFYLKKPIRKEIKFSGVEELKEQISKDIASVRTLRGKEN